MHDFKIVYLLDFFSLLPAPAGVILTSGAPSPNAGTTPRTRGGDPMKGEKTGKMKNYSPHPRG